MYFSLCSWWRFSICSHYCNTVTYLIQHKSKVVQHTTLMYFTFNIRYSIFQSCLQVHCFGTVFVWLEIYLKYVYFCSCRQWNSCVHPHAHGHGWPAQVSVTLPMRNTLLVRHIFFRDYGENATAWNTIKSVGPHFWM